MAQQTEGRISRSEKKTIWVDFSKHGKPVCPKCGSDCPQSSEYDYLGDKKVLFLYRCKDCGQTFKRVVNVDDI